MCYDKENNYTKRGRRMEIRPGKYRHFKGGLYEVVGMAKHSETGEDMVVYRALYGEYGLWVRPARMWNETVERGGVSYRRFTPVEPSEADLADGERGSVEAGQS